MKDIRDRFSEAHRISAPDLWEEITHRARSEPSERHPEHRWLTIAVAAVVAVAGVGLGVFALRTTFTSHGLVGPAPSSKSSVESACDFPSLRPATLPWLASGDPIPEPDIVGEYKRVN